jgi:hypothetical protein
VIKARKPFSEMTRDEQIAEARAAIARLRHPHNDHGYAPTVYAAIERWRATLKRLGATEES